MTPTGSSAWAGIICSATLWQRKVSFHFLVAQSRPATYRPYPLTPLRTPRRRDVVGETSRSKADMHQAEMLDPLPTVLG
jgi:hypothetical protein